MRLFMILSSVLYFVADVYLTELQISPAAGINVRPGSDLNIFCYSDKILECTKQLLHVEKNAIFQLESG